MFYKGLLILMFDIIKVKV